MPQCPHHVTQRGNERRDIFYTSADREVYLGLLRKYTKLYGVELLGYCLMTNHVHLVLLPHTAVGLAKVLREVHIGAIAETMATAHMSEAEVARDLHAALAKVR